MATEILRGTARGTHVEAVIRERQIAAAAKERQAIADEFDRQEEEATRQLNAREEQAEAAVAEWVAKTGAAVTVEFLGKRITIRLDHRDTVIRDIARNGANMLAQSINQMIYAGINSARTFRRADFEMDPLWLEKLLSLDLQYAHARGLVTITDLKGKPVKPKKLTPANATSTTVQTGGVRGDAWLSGAGRTMRTAR